MASTLLAHIKIIAFLLVFHETSKYWIKGRKSSDFIAQVSSREVCKRASEWKTEYYLVLKKKEKLPAHFKKMEICSFVLLHSLLVA